MQFFGFSDGASAVSNADEADHSVSKKYFKAWHLKKGMKKIGGETEDDGNESEILMQNDDDEKITTPKVLFNPVRK